MTDVKRRNIVIFEYMDALVIDMHSVDDDNQIEDIVSYKQVDENRSTEENVWVSLWRLQQLFDHDHIWKNKVDDRMSFRRGSHQLTKHRI